MNPRIYNQPAGTPHFISETSEITVRITIEARLQTYPGGINPPSLAKCIDIKKLAKFRDVWHFTRQGNLQVMARYCLVQCQRFERIKRPAVERICIYPIITRLRAALSGFVITSSCVFW